MDSRKSDSYVSCIKIRGVPIIPPLMTDDVRAEMRYYKGLALAVQERLTQLENSTSFSAGARTASALTGGDGSSRAAESLDGNADGETDYPDERGRCGSESPDATTGSVDLTPGSADVTAGSADVTASTDVDRYLADPSSAERIREKSVRRIEEQRSAQQVWNVEAQRSAQQCEEKTEARRSAQPSEEKVEAQRGAQQKDEKMEVQCSAQQKDEKTEAQRSAQQKDEKVEAQRGAQQKDEEMEAQRGAQQKDEEMEAQRSARQKDEKMEAQRSARQKDEKMEAQRSAQQKDEKMEAQQKDEKTRPPRSAQQSEEKIEARRGAQQNEVKLETEHGTRRSEEKPEAQRAESTAAGTSEARHGARPIPDQSVPESRRARVPKSLDIVPITLEATASFVLDRTSVRDSATSASMTESDETTPKLVRQGSYVLETPSPMLLARMRQVGEDSPIDYAPTSRDAPRRRAWNITEARTSWELRDINRPTKNDSSQARATTSKRRVAGSADCIRSMVDRESRKCPAKSNGSTGQYGRRNVTRNGTSILAMANKLGGSLGNLGRRTTGSRASRSADDVVASPARENFRTRKLLASVTTDKILDVFEQIRGAHERQMSQLLNRQRREQREMQRDFATQTKILVAQIESTFPGVRLPEINARISESSTSPDEPDESERGEASRLRQGLGINGFSPKDDPARCPLNGILPCRETPYSGRVVDDRDDEQRRDDRRASRRLFPVDNEKDNAYGERHVKAATVINAYARGYLARRLMETERVLALRTTYGEALRCMLRLHVDAPLALPELNFHQRLQLQCDAASMNIVELFAQEPAQRMEIIKQDREVKFARRQERPNSARSCYSFATQRTLARKKLKEMGDYRTPVGRRSVVGRSRCQTWTSNAREKRSPSVANQGIKRSTSAGAVRKPWR